MAVPPNRWKTLALRTPTTNLLGGRATTLSINNGGRNSLQINDKTHEEKPIIQHGQSVAGFPSDQYSHRTARKWPSGPHPYTDPVLQIFTRFVREISTAVAARRRCENLVSATADELFCWLRRSARQQGRPAATSTPSKHSMFAFRVSSSGMRFASQTNTQMRSGFNKALL
jgi:hypothetical protein